MTPNFTNGSEAVKSINLFDRILRKFSREISTGKMIPEIDGLRFLSISLVFLYHLCGYILVKKNPVYTHLDMMDQIIILFCGVGHYGVQIFFAISGFILALPRAIRYRNFEHQVSIKSYFMRRISRLEPPYILNLSILAFLLWIIGKAPGEVIIKHYGASVFYLHNLIYSSGSLINSIAWSLEVEIQFYILVPLLSCIFKVQNRYFRIVILWFSVIATVIGQTVFIFTPLWQLTILNHLQYFIIGLLVANDYVFHRLDNSLEHSSGSTMWDYIGFFAMIIMLFAWIYPQFTKWIFPVSLYFFFRSVLFGKGLSIVFSNPWITAIGGMCYTIYLYHYLIISSFGRIFLPNITSNSLKVDLLLMGSALGLCVITCSAILFLLVEKPCMRRNWPRELLGWLQKFIKI